MSSDKLVDDIARGKMSYNRGSVDFISTTL